MNEATVAVKCMPELIAQDQQDDCPAFATWAVAAVAVVAGIVAALSATRYGYYYDELYFIAAGKRPSFSYADQGLPVAKFGVRLGMPLVTRDIIIWECAGPAEPWSSMWPKMRNL
jgi:hypothetical protein